MSVVEVLNKLPFQGASMNPLFSNANFVWVDFSKTQAPQVGDVIVYQGTAKDWTCHRLIGMPQDLLCLKGDNSPCLEVIALNSFWGRVVAFEKNGKNHTLKNHFLLRLNCWLQMKFIHSSSHWTRKISHKLGFWYLCLIHKKV
jgi:hypothetical protein